jgi:hypothetical protein
MRFACRITRQVHGHTFVIFNTYCFSTATVAARTRLNVRLFVPCLSCCFCFVTVFYLLSRLFCETFVQNYSSINSTTGYELERFKAGAEKAGIVSYFLHIWNALKSLFNKHWKRKWLEREADHSRLVTTFSICGAKTQYPNKFSLCVTEETNLHFFSLLYFPS